MSTLAKWDARLRLIAAESLSVINVATIMATQPKVSALLDKLMKLCERASWAGLQRMSSTIRRSVTTSRIAWEPCSIPWKPARASLNSITLCSFLLLVFLQMRRRTCIRLPQLDQPKINRKYISWRTFMELLRGSMSSNAVMPDVQNLQYLQSFLENGTKISSGNWLSDGLSDVDSLTLWKTNWLWRAMSMRSLQCSLWNRQLWLPLDFDWKVASGEVQKLQDLLSFLDQRLRPVVPQFLFFWSFKNPSSSTGSFLITILRFFLTVETKCNGSNFDLQNYTRIISRSFLNRNFKGQHFTGSFNWRLKLTSVYTDYTPSNSNWTNEIGRVELHWSTARSF